MNTYTAPTTTQPVLASDVGHTSQWLTRELILSVAFCVLVTVLAFPAPASVYVIITFGIAALLLVVRTAKPQPTQAFNLVGQIVLLLCVAGYVLGILNSGGKVFHRNVQDMPGVLLAFGLPFLFTTLSPAAAKGWLNATMRILWLIALAISLLALYKFAVLLNGAQLQWLASLIGSSTYPHGTALDPDYNFFTIPLFIGIISAFRLAARSSSSLRVVYLMSVLPLIVSILFAGSRRAWVVLALLTVYGALTWLKTAVLTRNFKPLVQIVVATSIVTVATISLNTLVPSLRYEIFDEGSPLNVIWVRLTTITGDGHYPVEQSFDDRLESWDYAIKTILPRYTTNEMLLGQGFGYLYEYARAFPAWGADEFYPHNPFISAMHYSGLVGVGAVLLWLLVVTIQSFRLRTTLGNFAWIINLIFLAFCMVSGNSIFSTFAYVFLSVLLLKMRVEPPVNDSPITYVTR
jgi:hypothetical protein